jgi:rubrerythrin
MTKEKNSCQHRCRNTCSMLHEALRDEAGKIAFYEQMLGECDDPAMRKFVKELVSIHNGLIEKIRDRLNEISATAEALDGVIASFEQ